jgi:4-oxalocrotonate tautomerase
MCCAKNAIAAVAAPRYASLGNTHRNRAMPEVIVHAVEGRSAEQKKALCADITAAVVKHFNAPIDAVTVTIIEAPRETKMKGGVMFSER